MSTVLTWQTSSNSSAQTEQLAEQVGHNLHGGEIIQLVSDLGGGKTTFVRGLAKGLGSQQVVSSPSFKLSNVYKGSKLTLNHFDFYRLPEAGVMNYEINELLDDKSQVLVVEWGEVVNKVLPKNRLTVTIDNNGNNQRLLKFSYTKSLSYILRNIK